MRENNIIIGITGAFGSGKTTAAGFFEKKGFRRITLAELLEEEARKRGIVKITRKILQDIGNQWREKYGTGILAKKALALLEKVHAEKAVVEGIRNTGEIEELRRSSKFSLIAIVSDKKVRFERLKKLKRREKLTRELFNKLDKRDAGVGQKETGLQVNACIKKAEVFIENNGSLEEFKEKLEKFIQSV